MSVQINLRLPETLANAAASYANHYGYRNLQELATQALREKVLEESEFDETFTEKEVELIEALAEMSIKKGLIRSEEELITALKS